MIAVSLIKTLEVDGTFSVPAGMPSNDELNENFDDGQILYI